MDGLLLGNVYIIIAEDVKKVESKKERGGINVG